MSRVHNRLESLENRRLLAAISWDGGGDGTSWNNPLNWSNNLVPTSADDVTINIAGTPTISVSTGAQVAKSINSAELLSLTGGSLAVTGTATLTAGLEINGGAVTDGTFNVSGVSTYSRGTLDGATVVLNNNGTATMPLTNGYFDINNGATFTTSAAVTLDSSNSGFAIRGGSSSHIDIKSGGSFDIVAMNFSAAGLGGTRMDLDVMTGGSIRKTAGDNTINLDTITNLQGGTLGANIGVLNLTAGGTHTGGTLANNGGEVRFTGGTNAFTGAYNTTFTGGVIQGASWNTGAGTMTLNGRLDYRSGDFTSGTLNIASTAVLNAASTIGYGDFRAVTVNIAGKLVENTSTSGYALRGGQGGVFNINSGGLLDLQAGNFAGVGLGGVKLTVNIKPGGTLGKTAGANTVGLDATVNLQGGTLGASVGLINLNAGGTHTGGALANTGGLVRFAGGTHVFGGTYTTPGANAVIDGATFSTGTMTLNGNLDYRSGNFTSGTLNIASTAVLNAASTTGYGDFRAVTVNIAGKLVENTSTSGYAIRGGQGAVFNINSGGLLDLQAGAFSGAGLGGDRLVVNVNNGGTLGKTAGDNSIDLDAFININTGTIDADIGTLRLVRDGTHTNPRFSSTGGSLQLAGATQTITGTITTIGSPPLLTGATLTSAATGTMALAGQMQVISGTLSAARLTINAGSTLNYASTTGYFDIREGTALTVSGLMILDTGTSGYALRAGETSSITIASGGSFDFRNGGYAGGALGGSSTFNVNTGGTLTKTTGNAVTLNTPVNLNGGTFAGSTAEIAMNAGGTFTGGTMNFTGGSVRLNGGTFTLTGSYSGNTDGLVLQGATLISPSTATFNSRLRVLSGTIDGGTFLFTNGSSLKIELSNAYFDLRGGTILRLQGAATFDNFDTGYSLRGGQAAVIDIDPTGVLSTGNGIIAGTALGGTRMTIDVGGTLTKTSATGNLEINATYLMTGGTINAASGQISLIGDATGGGTYRATGMGTLRFASGTFDIPAAGRLTGTGTALINGATVTYAGSVPADPTTLNAASGTFRLAPGGHAIKTQNFSRSGIFDLTDGVFVLDYAGASPIATIASELNGGYSGGSWNGFGIRTSLGNSSEFALGYAEASQVAGSGTFRGVSVDNTSVIVAFTRYGDANLDGIVNVSDLGLLASNFRGSGGWGQGNFNYGNGVIDVTDLGLLASNFRLGISSSLASVGGTTVSRGSVGSPFSTTPIRNDVLTAA